MKSQTKIKKRSASRTAARVGSDAMVRPSPVARALKNYKETLPYHDARDHRTLGTKEPWRYLGNRLESAFLEGVRAGERIAAERIAGHIARIAADCELPLLPLA